MVFQDTYVYQRNCIINHNYEQSVDMCSKCTYPRNSCVVSNKVWAESFVLLCFLPTYCIKTPPLINFHLLISANNLIFHRRIFTIYFGFGRVKFMLCETYPLLHQVQFQFYYVHNSSNVPLSNSKVSHNID